jgi:BirA family biotin operon repressor/biotin-[acetyl-CoA-carboxylase] ligase
MERFHGDRLSASVAHVAFVRRIVVCGTTGSTNDEARRLAGEGAEEGTVVIAERQTAGRGRLGHAWDSPDGLGLYLSLVLRPTESADRIGRYTIAAAVAVGTACRAFAGERVVLKWPNDVHAGGRKLAGILAELRQKPRGAELVLGIGLNVGQCEADFPAELSARATSLRMLGAGVGIDREAAAASVLESLAGTIGELRAGGWPEVAARFLRYAPDATGRPARVGSGAVGVTDGLDDSGALRVRTAGGIVLAHATESVSLLTG